MIRWLAALSVTALVAAGAAHPAFAQDPPPGDQKADQAMKGPLTEAQFVTMMLAHHQDGVALARVEERHGSSTAVKSLAAKIRASKERDIVELRNQSRDLPSPDRTGGREAINPAMERESLTMMLRLKSASGDALDRAFLQEMAKHHETAIDVAGRTTFETASLRVLSDKIVAAQRQELDAIRKLLAAPRPPK